MKLQPRTKDAYRLFHEGILAFARAEQAGIRVDLPYCEEKKAELTTRIKDLESQVLNSKFGRHWAHSSGKVNLRSNYQLAHFLYDVKKFSPAKTTASGKGSVDDEALSALRIPEVDKILEMRKLLKVRDTYLDAFLREQVRGVIHPFFNLHLVRTFRSSSDSPNFQNIPKRDKESMKICRRALYPRQGHRFVAMDFSGIEVRMACVYTQDERLIHDTLHGDMHRDMAKELYCLDQLDKHISGEAVMRQGAKNGFVFPQFYGDYYGNCANSLLKWAERAQLRDGTPCLVHLHDQGLVLLDGAGKVKAASKFYDHVQQIEDSFWNERYRTYTKWKDQTWEDYQKNGYIDMYTGFRCGGVMNKKDVTNYPFQGTAFHCLLWTFIEIDRRMREEHWDSRPVSQIHDEVTLDTAPEEFAHVVPTIRDIACKALPEAWEWINVPLEVEVEATEVNASWGADKEFLTEI